MIFLPGEMGKKKRVRVKEERGAEESLIHQIKVRRSNFTAFIYI